MSNMIIPEDLKLVNAVQSSPAIVHRESITLYPTGDNVVESGRGSIQSGRIEFKLPVNTMKSWDCSTMFIHFNFVIRLNGVTKAAAANITRIHVHDSIESIIKTLTVDMASGSRLEFISDYNALESCMNYYCASDYIKSFAAPCMKAGVHSHIRNKIYHRQEAATTLTTAGSEATNQFTMPLRLSGISSPDFVLPSALFGSGGFLTITLELESPTNCIVAQQETTVACSAAGVITGGACSALTGSTIFYELSNIRMTLDAITYSAEYENMLASALASSKLVYPIRTWDVQARQIAGGGQVRYTENLSYNYSSVNAIFVWFVKQSEQNTHAFAGKDRLYFPDNLKDIQFRVNGFPVPASRPIDCTGGATEAYVHTIEALGLLHTAEQYGGLYSDQNVNLINLYTDAALTTPGTVGAYLGADTFYGSNRSLGYGFPLVATTVASNETTGPSIGAIAVSPTIAATDTTANILLPYQREMAQSHFCVGVNLKKLLRSAPGEISGTNLASTSGQIQYELNFSSANNTAYIMYVALLYDKFIELNNQSVVVNQ